MSTFIEFYRQHKDLLSPYFASEEDAANCERRAELGDDRALRVMSLAYDSRILKKRTVRTIGHDADGEYTGTYTFDYSIPIASAIRDSYHQKARKAANSHALAFSDSIKVGNRSCIEISPRWHPELDGSKTMLQMPSSTIAIRNDAPIPKFRLTSSNALRYELTSTTSNSVFPLVHFIGNAEWLPDANAEGHYDLDNSHWVYKDINIIPLKTCAEAGNDTAARLLQRIYEQSEFKEQVANTGFLNKLTYKSNPLYNPVKAKEWERIAEHLEGKTTPVEREKFLKAFLYSQDGTPEGLYNIGYALYHNEHIGNKARGLDYLKHAANLGDANAARELGEIAHNAYEADPNNHAQLLHAFAWYSIAAALGHPNGKARAAYLSKAYPIELDAKPIDEATLRNPSPEHRKQYPASAWYVDVPITDVANILSDTSRGGIMQRMEAASSAINDHVKEFSTATAIIQARIDDIIARQAVLDGRVERMKGEEVAALRENMAITRQQQMAQRSIDISRDRWIKETSLNLSGTVISGALFGGANSHQLLSIGNSAARAAGYRGVMQNEADYGQALIETLEAQKIDTSKFPEEIKALTLAVQQVADSKPMQALLKDETRARALVEGHLRQRILASGLENCRLLNDYVKDEAIPSLDAFLDTFKAEDTRLHQALSNLCYGHANSNDISVILAESNGLRGDDMPKHHRVLKAFVESTLKGSISHYMTRASQIDVIQDLRLIDVHTMTPDLTKTGAALVQTHAHATDTIRKDIDAQTRLAMTTLFATEFGVSHIGQYDVSRMFSFYLHRHGRHELISSELLDGKVGMENELKAVHVRTPSEMRGFVERTKMRARLDGSRSTEHMKEEQPHAGALFLRTCGYEYFLPQAVITSGRNNRLAENPEAPVAYPMVNKVLETFIERLSLSDIATYRQKIGEELDSLIAQSFIDFFKEVGTKHAEKFAEQRALLRDAYNNDNYSGRFDAYCDRITKDALGEFPLFMKIYERNLQKTLETAPDSEAALLQKQIDALHDTAKDYLAPNVTRPGSFQDKERARTSDHRGENMTERWSFGS